jgi:hypothetical protein
MEEVIPNSAAVKLALSGSRYVCGRIATKRAGCGTANHQLFPK